MLPLIRSAAAPLMSLVFLILASGLFNTFVSIRLELEGFAADTVGLITSFLYVGILVGSLYLTRFIERWGYLRSLALFSIVSVVVILAQALWIDPYFWAAMRLVGGICTAGIFIVIESWLLLQSPKEMRGVALSLYLGTLYLALSLGQFLINLADPKTTYPFLIAASLCALSLIPILMNKVAAPKLEAGDKLSLGKLFHTSPVGFLGGVISGMLLAALYGLGPIYGKGVGMSVSEVGTFMAVIIFGGLVFQWPMGRFADKGNRRLVLNTACFSTATLGILIAFFEGSTSSLLLPLAWFFGGFSFTIYPLSMAYVCEKIDENQIVAATGGFVLSYGIGAIAGPILAPFAMSFVGHSGLFYFIAFITFGLGIFGLKKPKGLSLGKAVLPLEVVREESDKPNDRPPN